MTGLSGAALDDSDEALLWIDEASDDELDELLETLLWIDDACNDELDELLEETETIMPCEDDEAALATLLCESPLLTLDAEEETPVGCDDTAELCDEDVSL